jgi:hypothetical protein
MCQRETLIIKAENTLTEKKFVCLQTADVCYQTVEEFSRFFD